MHSSLAVAEGQAAGAGYLRPSRTPFGLQALALVVSNHMGGPATSALPDRWAAASQQLKEQAGGCVIHLGSLRAGLSRHRALLFKSLADACQIPCRMLRGRFYTGVDLSAAAMLPSVTVCCMICCQVGSQLGGWPDDSQQLRAVLRYQVHLAEASYAAAWDSGVSVAARSLAACCTAGLHRCGMPSAAAMGSFSQHHGVLLSPVMPAMRKRVASQSVLVAPYAAMFGRLLAVQ